MNAPDPMPTNAEPAVTVTLRENGPVVITGRVSLYDGSETTIEQRLFLCRCGQSAKKPACDGTHKTCGFEAPGQAVNMK